MATKFNWLQCYFLVLFFSSLVSSTMSSNNSLRFLVSANGLSNTDSHGRFFKSRVFLGSHAPFVITDANKKVFILHNSTGNIVFLSPQKLSAQDIISAQNPQKIANQDFFTGPSFHGLDIHVGSKEKKENIGLAKYLGAQQNNYLVEKREINNKQIFAVKIQNNKMPIPWPAKIENLRQVPAVLAHVIDNPEHKYVFWARAIGDFNHRLLLLQDLKNKQEHTYFLDMGSNNNSISEQQEKLALLAPKLIFSGLSELSCELHQFDCLEKFNRVAPFGENFVKRLDLITGEGNKISTYFYALAHKEPTWPLFKKLGKKQNIQIGLKHMQKTQNNPDRHLTIVKAFSKQAADIIAKSPYVDLVLLADHNPASEQPRQEIVRVHDDQTDSYAHFAPVISISSLDITEILISFKQSQYAHSLAITRFAITDKLGPAESANKDINTSLLLPQPQEIDPNKTTWESSDFDKILGHIFLEHSGADISLFAASPNATPIKSGVAQDVLLAKLNRMGSIALVKTTGQVAKDLIKASSLEEFSDIAIVGRNSKNIEKRERVTIVLSEKALLKIFGIARLGGFTDIQQVRAPFAENMIGKITNLWFISGPGIITVSDTLKSIKSAMNNIKLGQNINELVKIKVLNSQFDSQYFYQQMAQKSPKHRLLFDIKYLDLGFSKNFANSSYEHYINPDTAQKLPLPRGGVPLWAHVLLVLRSSLTWDAPGLISKAGLAVTYLQTNFNNKPEKDKIKVTLDFRLPWERSLFEDSPVIVSPIWKNTYETKIAPIFPVENPKDNWNLKPRDKLLKSLLGINLDFTNLGFDLDIGALGAANFNQKGVQNILDFGPGLNFNGYYNIYGPIALSGDFASYYLFPLPKNTATSKIALGLEGNLRLRVARFYDMSIALMSNYLLASLQESPDRIAFSSIFGITISYGRLFRLFG